MQAWGQPATLPQKEVRFDQLPAELNLGERTINCMLQDQAGHLWMGTWSGLIRYDGYEAILYQATPQQLKSNKITCLLEGADGHLWIGTRQAGLFRYHPVTNEFTQYGMGPEGQQLSNPNVWSLAWGKDSALWVGTEAGLNRMDLRTGDIEAYLAGPGPDDLLNDYVRALHWDAQGDLWVGTEQGLHRLAQQGNSVTFERYLYGDPQEISEPHNYIYQIGGDPESETLWFTTKAGLKRLQNDTLTIYVVNPALAAANHFRTLRFLSGPTPYILTGSETGLALYDPKAERFLRFWGDEANPSGLSHTTIMCVYIDQTEVLWVGTKKGLNRFDTYDKGFVQIPTATFDESASILTGITGGGTGDYWVSTLGGGLYRAAWQAEGERLEFSSKAWTQAAGDYIEYVQTLCLDPQGYLWVGTAGSGVLRVDPNHPANAQRFTRFDQYNRTSTPALSDDYVMALAPSSDGGMWVGTWSKGLNKIMPDGTLRAYTNEALTGAPLVTLYEDVHGTLWIGTRGQGLYRALPTAQGELRLTNYRTEATQDGSLNNDFINAILEDRVGGFWVGTESGLSFFDRRQGRFSPMGLEGTRPIDMVVGMLEDDAGHLWLSHWEGLTQYEPLKDNTQPLHYDRGDRIQGGFFYNNVCYRDPHGRLLFGGANGLNVIHPNRMEYNPFPAQVSLQSVRVFDQPLTAIDSLGYLQGEVQLKHNQNSLSFEFAALHFAAPEKNQFAYRLVGYDDAWIYTDADRRFASYTNLSPAEYRFEVRASNNDGLWGEPLTMAFTISPP
ncbi:MAG: two-component regulator propeller domain-containing protein [Bacteroidota bacterium]